MGFTVSITTNGYFLNETKVSRLVPFVDWIGISIDSVNEDTEKALGRGNGNHVAHSVEICNIIHKYNIRLSMALRCFAWAENNCSVIKLTSQNRSHSV
jgi:radical S-adenosyl methionine domain-containing protein 2